MLKMLFSPTVLFLLVFSFLCIICVRRFSSPLRRLPGPTYTNLTSLILKFQALRGERTRYIHRLHQKYGPVVRIGPDEVSFTSWPAIKEIYCSNGSGYDKTEFYDLFKIYGRRTMFTTLNKADHAKRKRILADRYANSNIMKGVSMTGIQERSLRFIERIVSTGSDSMEIFIALHAYACDCVTHHLFQPHSTNCLQWKDDEEMMHQVAADDSLQNRLLSFWLPTLHHWCAGILSRWFQPRETPLADDYVLNTSKLHDHAQFTLMGRMREKSGELEPIDMAAECLDHMAAGIDTTGDALCFLLWELSQPRSRGIQERLQHELRSNPDAQLEQLPFLDAVVSEGLRYYPPIPMSLPRYVPAGGRSIDGVWIPEKTIVSCQALSVHFNNPQVFQDQDRFEPARWLVQEGDTERRRLLFAFANGGRGCIGKHLALAEMKTLLRDVYSRFSTRPDPLMKPDLMVMADQLISSRPLGQSCLLRFEPLD